MRSRLVKLFRLSAALIILVLAAGNLSTMSSAQSNPKVTALSAGGHHSLALKSDGTVWAWGDNDYGQLGTGSNVGPGSSNSPNICMFYACSAIPVQVTGLSDIIAIAAGVRHSLAVKKDGTAWTWGANAAGANTCNGIACSTTPVQITGLSDVKAIAAGASHSLAVKSDGTVWAWGTNYDGQLGIMISTQPNTCSPVGCSFSPTPIQITSLSDITAIVAGQAHSLALKKDGTVQSWGADNFGQLGIGGSSDTCGRDACTPTPIRLDLNNVTAIAAGSLHSLALKSDGTIWAWGMDVLGQLGTSTTARCMQPGGHEFSCSPSPVEVADLSGVAMIAAGEEHSLALKQDGTVWAWGNNAFGQLGTGSSTGPNKCGVGEIPCSRTPVQVKGL